jgi:hypothetical protein
LNAIAIEVSQRDYRNPELIGIVQNSEETSVCVADLLLGLDGPVSVQEQHPHRSTVSVQSTVVVESRTHGQIRDTVPVQIAKRCQGTAKLINILKDAGKATCRLADLLFGFDGPIGIEEQHPHRPTVGPAIIIPGGAYG